MDTKSILAELRTERDRINHAITALETLNGAAAASGNSVQKSVKVATSAAKPAGSVKRVISDEARQRMADAQHRRWAKRKRAVKAAAKKTSTPAASKA